MNTLVLGAFVALGMVQQTDTTFAVGNATRLEVESPGGSITIGVWDRNEVRVRAEHSSRTYVDIDVRGGTIDVEAEARRGPANIVDFVITVPRSFDLEADGMYTDILIEGADGEVEAESMQGDVTIRGGRGVVKVGSVQGRVLIEGSQGRVEVETAASEIRVRNAAGEIVAESSGGDIILENVRATSVDVGTVGGRVYYNGTFERSGTYFFGSHGGSVTLALADGAAASITVATIHGSVTSNLAGAPTRFERGQRNSFDVNGGGALVEVETFGGRIRLVRQGTEGGTPPAAREHSEDDHAFGWGGDMLTDVLGETLSETVSIRVSTSLGADFAERISHAVDQLVRPSVARRFERPRSQNASNR